jgi:hypothetical protein
MAKKQVTNKKARAAALAAPLGPGLHAGTIELRSGESFRVRMLHGPVVAATLDDAVDPELARECLRTGRRVIVAEGAHGPVILGALQTSVPVACDADGNLAIAAKKIRLRAETALVVESGESSLRLHPDGVLKIEGDKLVIDVGGLVRFHSARVEFP